MSAPTVYAIVYRPWEGRGGVLGWYSFREGPRYRFAGDRLVKADGTDVGEVIHRTSDLAEHNEVRLLLKCVEEVHDS